MTGIWNRRRRSSNPPPPPPEPAQPADFAAILYQRASEKYEEADKYLAGVPAVKQVADWVSLRPVLVPVLGIGAALILCGFFEDLVLGLAGFLYPAWCSFKTLEKEDQIEARRWLVYWVVYAAFSIVSIVLDWVAFIIPFYHLLKLGFVLWLLLPQFQGALTVYNQVLRPLFRAHQNSIDRMVGAVTAGMSPAIQEQTETTGGSALPRRKGS